MPADVKPVQASPTPAHETHDASDALSAVVHSATAVAQAELRLVKVEVRAWLTRMGYGLFLLWLSLLLLQVFVLLLALTPVLAQRASWMSLGLMLSLSLLPTVGALWLAARELRRPKELGNASDEKHDQ
jgi:hypothetical protein